MSEMLSIQIKNWEKYNKRQSGYTRSYWFAMSNDFFSQKEFVLMTPIDIQVWLYVLCEASKVKGSAIDVFVETVTHFNRQEWSVVKRSLEKLSEFGWIEFAVHEPAMSRPGADRDMATTITITKTKERTSSSDDDQATGKTGTLPKQAGKKKPGVEYNKEYEDELERIYQTYPHKVGKKKGKLRIRSLVPFERLGDLEKAIEVYTAYKTTGPGKGQALMGFDTFPSVWEDWYEKGKTEPSSQTRDMVFRETEKKDLL